MTLNYLGYMMADRGTRLPEALTLIRKAVELEPTSGAYLDSLGWVYFKMGEYELAEENLRQAVDRDRTDPTVHDHLGELYAKTNRIRLAAELADQGQADEGLGLAKGLLDGSEKDRAVWLALGQMNIRLRRWKDADDAFNKAFALTTKKEDRTYLLFLRGEWSERQKHYGPAERFFREALEQDPKNAMTLNYLGYMLADRGTRLPEALTLIRKAVELEPINGAYLDSLGWVYFKMGDYELAEENLRQAVERDRTDPTVHDHMGELYAKTGRIRLAAAQWELSLAEYAKSAPADVDPADVARVQRKLESARVKLAKQENALGPAKPE